MVDKVIIFKLVVIILLVLTVVNYFIYSYEIRNANIHLLTYLRSLAQENNGLSVFTIVLLLMYVIKILSCIFLLFGKYVVRHIFTLSVLMPMVAHLFSDYLVVGPLGAFVDSTIILLSGIVIAFLYQHEQELQ